MIGTACPAKRVGGCRACIYNDPLVLAHARALLTSGPEGATASSIWAVVFAPTSGAATTGLRRSQASAICARVTPRASASRPAASMMARSLSAVRLV
jgi:hypothetical protein